MREKELPKSLIPDVSLSKPKFPDWWPVSSDYHYLMIIAKFKDLKDSEEMKALLDKMAKSVKSAIKKRSKVDPYAIKLRI